MIKINLMKSFAVSGAEQFTTLSAGGERDKFIIDAIKRIVIIIIGPAAIYMYELKIIPELQGKLQQVQNELTETTSFNQSKSGLANEIKKYEEEQLNINGQMNFINKLARDKINEFKLFRHLQNATPESVWINRLEFKDNELMINAESDVQDELNKFSVRLSNADFLSNIIPIDQDVKADPFGVGISTTSQNLKARFNTESSTP